MASRIQLRRGTAAEWQAGNPVLAEGELGVELDTSKCKVGDGLQNWNDLLYAIGATGPAGANGTNGTNGTNGIDGTNGVDGAPGPMGPMGGTATSIGRLNMQGVLTPTVGTSRWYPSSTITITSLSINVGVASTSTVVVAIKKNNTTLQTITLNPAMYRSEISRNLSYTLSINDYITADILTAKDGSNLTVVMEYLPHDSQVLSISRLNYVGLLGPVVGTARWYPGRIATLSRVHCAIGTPSPTTVYANLLLNGTIILNLSLDAGAYKSMRLTDLYIAIAETDYLTVDIISAGGGRDLSVVLEYL